MDTTVRNTIFSILAGILCACSWWSLIIGWKLEYNYQSEKSSNQTEVQEIMNNVANVWTMPSVTFIGLVIINFIPNSAIIGDGFGLDGKVYLLRFFVFIGFLCMFVPLVASIWYGIEGFMVSTVYADNLGWAMIVSSVTMMLAGLIFKMGRTEEAWSAW